MILPKLDVVVPVLMPSSYFSSFREGLLDLDPKLRINYVLDYAQCKTDIANASIYLQPNERIFVGNFGSPGLARNKALPYCDSQFTCFWDVDDCPDIHQILKFIDELELSGRELGIGNWSYQNGTEVSQGVTPRAVGRSPGLWRFIFKTEIVKGILFSELKWGEDQLFLIEAFAKKPSILTTEHRLYRYRRNTAGSMTSQRRNAIDLPKAIKRSVPFLSKIDKGFTQVVIIMLLKQLYSSFKYGGFSSGIKSLLSLLPASRSVIRSPKTIVSILVKGDKW